jgi:2-keto-4-pentenoate hydratase/2-oxohepta-3-ene-1,7-dioic acid hydratase in catechol pathway
MDSRRRTFLKGTGAMVAAGVAGAPRIVRAAQGGGAPTGTGSEMPKQMTFATLKTGAGQGLGIRTERGILDVKKAEAAFRLKAPTTIDDVLHGRGVTSALAKLVDKAGTRSDLFVAESAAQFGPCVTSPEKIICVGLNYRKHAAETNNPVPTVPILFNKYNNTLNAHRGTIRVSEEPAEKFDYEVELVVVIGKRARHVSEADALSCVFGYCAGNDFTARDLQSRTSQWMVGKSLDGFAPIGPWLVTADQVPDPQTLKLETRVNGEVRQSSNTADMVFSCAQLVSFASRMFTLEPGDIIFTGTPEGVIAGYPKDRQVWLKAGDKLANRFDKLGELQFSLT